MTVWCLSVQARLCGKGKLYQIQILSFRGQLLIPFFSLTGTTVYTSYNGQIMYMLNKILNKIYPFWFIFWLASQFQTSPLSLSAVRHGTYETKLMMLRETQRSLEMCYQKVALIHEQLIHFCKIILVLAEEFGHNLHTERSDALPDFNQKVRSWRSHKTFDPFFLVIYCSQPVDHGQWCWLNRLVSSCLENQKCTVFWKLTEYS